MIGSLQQWQFFYLCIMTENACLGEIKKLDYYPVVEKSTKLVVDNNQ